MKGTRIGNRIIATFMAFIIAFVSAPIQAIALDMENAQQIEENIIDTSCENKDVFLVEEDLSKRGQFEKHYLCSDGTYVSVTYPEAVHYLDANNKWQDVDQSLSYDSATGMYISDKADFEVSFSNRASADNIARIERNGYTLSWGIQTIKKNDIALSRSTIQSNSTIIGNTDAILIPSSSVSAVIESSIDGRKTDIKDRLITDSDTFVLPKISSQISYSNIFDETQSVSLKYTVYHNKIEEDIIISERGNLQSVSMNMDIGTLTPIVNADGSVDLVNANYEMQFHIGIPYMVDANHSVCNDIRVTAIRDGTFCVITYTPNAEWFESHNRVFPILLDPSITTNDYVSNIEDTYVEENSTANHSSEQYLYIYPNGNNRRRAIVRVSKLPKIDASMPIISASLTLTAQYAPFSNVSLVAHYMDTGLELNEYDYYVATDGSYSYAAYSYLNQSSTRATFDFSSYIYEMYNDFTYDQDHNLDYHGDFVIGYSDNNDTTFTYPFHSVEYTTPSVRPVFTIKYGYTLPAGMLDGGVYSFQNCGSYSFMTVNGDNPANNSNVYQVYNEDDIATTTQKFKLEYVSSTGGYLLRSMASSSGSGKVVDIRRAGGAIYSGRNVQIYAATDPISQEWLIVPVNYDTFRLVPRANMELTLTAYGDSDGTNSGSTQTSPGNIFVKTFVEGNDYQEWYIYDNSNHEVNTSQYRAVIETGNYYILNSYTGKYLHRTNGVADCLSAKINSAGENTVKWKIVNLGDGYCTIGRSDLPKGLLAPASNSSGSSVRIVNNRSETIPDKFKWSIRTASGGGFLIQNKESGLYLSSINSTTNPSSVSVYALNAPKTAAYSKQVWRIANEDNYVELGYGVSFNDIAININESKVASINKNPSNAMWASYTDFDFSIVSGSQYVSYSASANTFTGLSPGVATIKAVHKTTGIARQFDVITDCFEPRCIEYIRYTRITGANFWGLGSKTDHTIGIVKSLLKEDVFCIILDNINDVSREYIINADLKNTLNELEKGYQEHHHAIPAFDKTTEEENAAHSAKEETDQLVKNNYFTSGSSEYYGAWAYNYVSTLNILNYFKEYIETYTAIYSVYLTATSFFTSYLAYTNTTHTSVSSSQYQNTTSYLDDIDDAISGIKIKNKNVCCAEERNLVLSKDGYTDPLPYEPKTPVVQFQHNEPTQYVRVYTSGSNKTGKWLMKYSDIQGLTPAQIQKKFALPNKPTHYCFVDVPDGTIVYVGRVNQSSVPGTLQYEAITRIPDSSFGLDIPLP